MTDLSVFSKFNMEAPQTVAGNSSLIVPVREDKVRGITGRFLPDATGETILTTMSWGVEGTAKRDDGKNAWVWADLNWETPDVIGAFLAAHPNLGVDPKTKKQPIPKTSYWAVFYVIKDDQYSSNNGRTMILPFSKAVYKLIERARKGREPFEPFDVVTGANFEYVRDADKKLQAFEGCRFRDPSDFTVNPTLEGGLEALVERLPVLNKDVKCMTEREQKQALKRAFIEYEYDEEYEEQKD